MEDIVELFEKSESSGKFVRVKVVCSVGCVRGEKLVVHRVALYSNFVTHCLATFALPSHLGLENAPKHLSILLTSTKP